MSLIHQFDNYYQVLPCLSLKTQSQEEKNKDLASLVLKPLSCQI